MRRLAIALIIFLLPYQAFAAIARDNSFASTVLSSNSISFSYTVNSNTNGMLFAIMILNDSGNPSSVTAATYNSVAMTRLTSEFNQGIAGLVNSFDIYYLPAPATGSNTFTATSVGATIRSVVLVSYTGVKQTGMPDANGTGSPVNDTGTVSSFTETVAPSASNVWGLMFATGAGGTYSAGTNTTKVVATSDNFTLFDTNAAQTGSFTMVGNVSSQRNSVSFFSIAPASTVNSYVSGLKSLIRWLW